MSDAKASKVFCRKVLTNRLLGRRQMIVDTTHPGRPNVSKAEMAEKLVQMFKVKDPKCVFLFGFKTAFGGGKSSGFACIYDSIKDANRFEPKYRLARAGAVETKAGSRKQRKERKNRQKKLRGIKKAKVTAKKK
eukprot:GFYU01000492.1.p1 GENE.GFYU01000492.1~~GFYU01000492.1.p1  ORF type:complete len:147 (+),score=50.39 GFYU01000492.1:40-441(+)